MINHRTFSGFRRLNNVPRFSYSWGLRLQRGHHAGKLGHGIPQYSRDLNIGSWLVDYLKSLRRCVQARLRPLWDLWAPLSNLMPSLTRGLQNPCISNFWALGFGISVAWLASYPNLDRLRYIAYFDRADIDGWEIRKVYCVFEFLKKKLISTHKICRHELLVLRK